MSTRTTLAALGHRSRFAAPQGTPTRKRTRRTSRRRPAFERLESRQMLAGDVALISIDNVSRPEGDEGQTEFEFTVSIDIVLDQDLTMQVDVADVGDGDQAADLVPIVAGSLTIPAGQTSANVTVSVLAETRVEADETFLVQLSNPSTPQEQQIEFAQAIGVGTIQNDDQALLSILDASMAEGDDGQDFLEITLSLDHPVGREVRVRVTTTDGTAVAGEDYEGLANAEFSIPAGQLTASAAVNVFGDRMVEGDEQFTVTLSDPTFGMLVNDPRVSLDDGQASVVIENDDAAILSLDNITITEGTEASNEDGLAPATLTLSLKDVDGTEVTADVPVSVQLDTIDGTALRDVDYLPRLMNSATINAGGSSLAITVDVVADDLSEADETFRVLLSNLSADGRDITLGGDGGEVTIEDDDPLPVISIDDVTMDEPGEGTVEFVFTVRLSEPSGQPVRVQFRTVDDTAENEQGSGDYQAKTGEVAFAPGGTMQAVRVEVNADTVIEEEERFFVELFDAQNGSIATGGERAVGTISGQETAPDPATSSLGGAVYVDADGNGQFDANETGLPGVTILLSGRSDRDEVVERTTSTGDDGSYSFESLPAGTYHLSQLQPPMFRDGPESTGEGGGETSGEVVEGEDWIRNIVLAADQAMEDYDFREFGLRAAYVSIRLSLASTPEPAIALREIMESVVGGADQPAEAASLPAASSSLASTFASNRFQRMPASASDDSASHADSIIPDSTSPDAISPDAISPDSTSPDSTSPDVTNRNPGGTDPDGGGAADGAPEDPAGGTDPLEPETDRPALVELRLEVTDLEGNVVQQVEEGDVFEVRVLAEDLRDAPRGVFAAYLDIQHDTNLAGIVQDDARPQGFAIEYGAQYVNVQQGELAAGQVDETGAVAGLTPLGGGEFLLFSVQYTAARPGRLTLTADPADQLPVHEVLLYGLNESVGADRIDYLSTSLEIVERSGEGEAGRFANDDPSPLNAAAVDQLMARSGSP